MLINKLLDIEYPIILAPMFLVTNAEMIKIALDNDITGAIPAMNYKTTRELDLAIKEIKKHSSRKFGINIIANKSNRNLSAQLETVIANDVGFIITSLGNPEYIIKQAKEKNIKVFCDVVDIKYAKKVEELGADGLIAVNNCAGGHSGRFSAEELIPELVNNCNIPVISAGGVSSPKKMKEMFELGASGVSIGTVFIASQEAPVSDEYKNALIKYSAEDIVLTSKLSGSPTTVINTEYVKQIGTKQSIWEKLIHSNSILKKFAKKLVFKSGMKKLEKAAFSTTYRNVWCAGPSIEDIHEIRKLSDIIKSYTNSLGLNNKHL